ncbi:hypothetical protein C2G38_2211443 [Gigaspora rosea]|uniref:DNA polymerase n=1 Tax=Gigaspora rosea TaxID=44941 RepID=A0A397UEE4_9GLOM|nr:hypothetical protein C2G38_2211443 [Gigaspora rosea]
MSKQSAQLERTLINGQKARVDITGIKPFFDILVPDNEHLSIFKPRSVTIISGVEKIDKLKFGMKIVYAYPIHGYHTEKKHDIEAASDDITSVCYYRKIAREERLPLSEMAVLRDNKPDDHIVSSALMYDRTLVLTWDIKTYSGCKMGDVPIAKYEDDRVFMICMTIHWKDDPVLLKRICFVDIETTPDPNWITIVCETQENLLKAFALCWKTIKPDIQIGFNDSQYDWTFIIEKAKSLGILEWMYNHMLPEPSNIEEIIKWKYRKSEIKVADKKFYSRYLKIPGKCELGSKADMPYNKMWKYYKDAILQNSDSSAKNMCEISYYCIIDALRYQELMVKRNVVNDYREVSSIAYVSLSDAHYFADGMKVYNLLGAEAWSSNMLCSIIASKNTESGKYPGAYVITPIKGLENKRPITGLDFATLYPSLIMTYNLSPDKIILSREEAINLAGGVTSAGQRNIKFVKKFVENKEFGIKYGDTDSLYLTCPEECFQKCDRKYKLNQLSQKVYWEEIVKISIGVMANLCNEVNTELEKDNGTPYLNIAYKEVLFPVEIMNRTLKIGNEGTVHQIVEKVLWENVEKLSKAVCFGMEAKYSREVLENQQLIKKGLPANEYLYKVPKPGERFSYIVVVPEEIYDNCRKKIPQQKGDCMEYRDVVKKFNKKINIDYYIKSLFGLCARFINYDDKYQPSSESLLKVLDRKKKSKEKKLKIAKDLLQSNDSLSLDEDEIAKIKDESQKLAKKWLKNYIKNLRDAPKKDEAIISHL